MFATFLFIHTFVFARLFRKDISFFNGNIFDKALQITATDRSITATSLQQHCNITATTLQHHCNITATHYNVTATRPNVSLM